MKFHYDLHVHSVLSACADVLMTPNNILNMASLKNIDILAVTDHNSLKQLPILDEISASYNILLVYGAEVELHDGSHILCYFKSLQDAMQFDALLESHMSVSSEISNVERQVLTDLYDEPQELIHYRLGGPTTLTMDDLLEILENFDHLRVFAHLDRSKNSGIRYLGSVKMDGAELTKYAKEELQGRLNAIGLRILHNSDAHQIVDISECSEDNVLEMESLSMEEFFRVMRHG